MSMPTMKDGKSPLGSLTMWGGAIFALLTYLESQGIFPEGAATSTAEFAQTLAGILALYGLRRAQGG